MALTFSTANFFIYSAFGWISCHELHFGSGCKIFSKTIIKIFQNTPNRDNIPKTIKEYADESSYVNLGGIYDGIVLLSVHNAINAFSKPHTLSELCEVWGMHD